MACSRVFVNTAVDVIAVTEDRAWLTIHSWLDRRAAKKFWTSFAVASIVPATMLVVDFSFTLWHLGTLLACSAGLWYSATRALRIRASVEDLVSDLAKTTRPPTENADRPSPTYERRSSLQN